MCYLVTVSTYKIRTGGSGGDGKLVGATGVGVKG